MSEAKKYQCVNNIQVQYETLVLADTADIVPTGDES